MMKRAYRNLQKVANFSKMSGQDSYIRRVIAISDIHVDYRDNLEIVESWSKEKYGKDALILAGDVTDLTSLLETTLKRLARVFAEVFFVPGNHDLWLRRPEFANSIEKFHEILKMCERNGIHTKPGKLSLSAKDHIWIVPLYSWYATPEEDANDATYITPQVPENIEKNRQMWMDNFACKWPDLVETRSKYFANLNDEMLKPSLPFDGPVISFSHFLPRTDLILSSKEEEDAIKKERERLNLEDTTAPKRQGGVAGFNFSRYAGAKCLETQIRSFKSTVHVHGHQHRNRDRTIDGVRYVSHCLGYGHEREKGLLWGLHELDNGPRQVWPLVNNF
ncbi:acyl-carrier-protein phosphodiesterase PptH-like [Lineus longissimus]|uniref:acyl-carrier-protein phosphodiesterase PptH-like n=1 Tax=Lineus longissimus TaxID=88925 RepID=UPI002B4F3BDC